MAALAVQAATWPLTATETDGWIYTGPPNDSTAPTVPVLAAIFNTQSTSFQAKLATASVDAQSGVRDYIFAIAPTATGVFVDQDPVAPSTALTGATFTGLEPSTAYQVKVKARDLASTPNVSAYSAVVSATTAAPEANTSWFPNWPVMRANSCQGNITSSLMDATQRDDCGLNDVFMFQWFYPTNSRLQSRSDACQYIKDNYPGCHLFMYTDQFETLKVLPDPPQNNALELTKNLVDGANGRSTWYMRTSGGAITEARFDPVNQYQLNGATGVAGTNNLGERYDQAFWRVIDTAYNGGTPANFADNFLSGYFVDNFNARAPDAYTGNGTTNQVNNLDMNGDAVAEVRNLYTFASNAGGKFWSDGGLNSKASFAARFPDLVMFPNAARWAYDYLDGTNQSPPLPLSLHPYYGKWEQFMKETQSNNLGLVPNQTALTYSFNGGGSASLCFKTLSIQEKFLCADSASPMGKAVQWFESRVCNRNPPNSSDYTYARFLFACAMLMPRTGICLNRNATRPFRLDEFILEFGNPVGNRSMGTLNETTLAFTMRAPDFTSGAAQFHWQRFEKAIVVIRSDSPTVGAYPSADTAVACTLPAPGTGKKWQRINAATYVSPAIYKGPGGTLVTRAMASQDTTLNSGADATTISLKPYHAAILRLVAA